MSEETPAPEERPTKEDILTAWLVDLGGRCPIRVPHRRASLIILFETFNSYGYVRSDIGSFQTEILETIYNKNYHKPEQKKTWKRLASNDMDYALETVWPKVKIASSKKAEKLKQADSQPAKQEEDSGFDDIDVSADLPSDTRDTKLNTDNFWAGTSFNDEDEDDGRDEGR